MWVSRIGGRGVRGVPVAEWIRGITDRLVLKEVYERM